MLLFARIPSENNNLFPNAAAFCCSKRLCTSPKHTSNPLLSGMSHGESVQLSLSEKKIPYVNCQCIYPVCSGYARFPVFGVLFDTQIRDIQHLDQYATSVPQMDDVFVSRSSMFCESLPSFFWCRDSNQSPGVNTGP